MESLVRLSFYCFAAATIAFVASAACYLAYAVGRVRLRQTTLATNTGTTMVAHEASLEPASTGNWPLRHLAGLVRRRVSSDVDPVSDDRRRPAATLEHVRVLVHLRPTRRSRLPPLRALVWGAPARRDRAAARRGHVRLHLVAPGRPARGQRLDPGTAEPAADDGPCIDGDPRLRDICRGVRGRGSLSGCQSLARGLASQRRTSSTISATAP